MKRYFAFILLISGLFISVNAQKLVNGGNPKLLASKGGVKAYNIQLPDGTFVHKFDRRTDEDRDSYFEIGKGKSTLGKINASVNASGGSVENFQAFYGDLDKNKSAELIIVDFEGQSNGLGVNYYTVYIFPDFQTKGFTKPISFSDYEFGADGTFLYDAKTKETLILLTEWGGVEIKDAKRGDGLYFTGKFFRYRDGKLKPATDKPILARRYLNSFEKERFRTDKDPRRPYLWLSSPNAIKLTADPIFAVKPTSTQSGVIEKYEEITEKYTENNETENVSIAQIIVRMDAGETKTVVLSKNPVYVELPSDKDKIFPETFGISSLKFTFPSGFAPLLSFDKLEGNRVQLNSYSDNSGDSPTYKLWFLTGN